MEAELDDSTNNDEVVTGEAGVDVNCLFIVVAACATTLGLTRNWLLTPSHQHLHG